MIEFLELAAIVMFMTGSAFFSGIETGIVSIHRMRLRHFVRQGLEGSDILQDFLEDSDRLLGTTLVGNNLCVVAVSVISASFAGELFGAWGEPASAVVNSAAVLMFCEYLPKAWFHARPIERSRRFTAALRFFDALFRPLSVMTVWFTRWITPSTADHIAGGNPFVSREDLKVLARESEEEGKLSSEERVMIHRVFDLSNKCAREVMIPRGEMIVVPHTASIQEFYEVARQSGLTRIPVLNEEKNEFVGIANVFYVLSHEAQKDEATIAWFARPPLVIRESMPVDDILPHMRRFRQPMCLVRNGGGDVIGLITTEDILEEIVGQL